MQNSGGFTLKYSDHSQEDQSKDVDNKITSTEQSKYFK